MRFFKYGAGALIAGCLIFCTLLLAIPLPEDKLHPPQAYRYYDRNGRILAMLISPDDFYRMHIPLSDIPSLFVDSLLLNEDKYFYWHLGINPLSILRAALTNIKAGDVVSGGSTITMQLARMLERRERTLWAKLIEAFRALQLELRYSKDEILAFYLALTPYGGNLEGIQAASYLYFGKPASMLSPGEIALLVALPKSPNQYRPDRHPHEARYQRDRILDKMLAGQLIEPDQYMRAKQEPVPTERRGVFNIIPHTAWHLRHQSPQRYVTRTTIDRNVQQRVNRILRNYIDTLEHYGISNAAAVVIDNENREIRAIAGSTDYYDRDRLGANDGSRAPRSPGSTLKPFLYGLAMQEGLIAEKTILYDIPKNYAGYQPQNYSQSFLGPVTAREALTESLNVVAVDLSNRLGLEKLHRLLQEGGISTLDKPAGYYGLPLVLGGVEVRLIDLTNLYSSLANRGEYRPYRLLLDESRPAPAKILSAEAAWLITHILTDVERPDFPSSWQFSKSRPTIAWKTGTSYGHQDAWSVGYTTRHTIGVWVGNFDGRPATSLAGSKAAGPLLFDLFQSIEDMNDPRWFQKPERVKTRQVCSVCGLPPNRHCRNFVREYYIEGVEGPATEGICEIPQLISIDIRTNQQATAATPAEYVRQRVFNVWPSAIAGFLLNHGVPVHNVPPYNPEYMAGQKYYPPTILAPAENATVYWRLDKLQQSDHGVKLQAGVTNRVRKIFWFLNDKLLAAVDPKETVLINPPPGEYKLELIDDVGGTDSMTLTVKDYREQLQHEKI